MPEEDADERHRRRAMDDARDAWPAEEMADCRRPDRVRVEQRHAGEHERDRREREAQMRGSPQRRPATEEDDLLVFRQVPDGDVRAHVALLMIAPFTEIPERP